MISPTNGGCKSWRSVVRLAYKGIGAGEGKHGFLGIGSSGSRKECAPRRAAVTRGACCCGPRLTSVRRLSEDRSNYPWFRPCCWLPVGHRGEDTERSGAIIRGGPNLPGSPTRPWQATRDPGGPGYRCCIKLQRKKMGIFNRHTGEGRCPVTGAVETFYGFRPSPE